MSDQPGMRQGEKKMESPAPTDDAGLTFIGHVETPWYERGEAPRNAMGSEVICMLHIKSEFREALTALEGTSHIVALYWLDRARRDLLIQKPAHSTQAKGTFALRSPNRPNPIGLSVCDLLDLDLNAGRLTVRHIDCLTGTPLLDIKPYFASTDAKPDAVVGWADTGR